MPKEFIKDEKKWAQAKEIVSKQYNKTEADGEEFYKLVMGVYKQARGTIQKKTDTKAYYHHKSGGKDRKRRLEEGRTSAPIARKSLIMDNVQLLDLDELVLMKSQHKSEEIEAKYPGGSWKTMHGRHVYIMKNGEMAPETAPRSGKASKKSDKSKKEEGGKANGTRVESGGAKEKNNKGNDGSRVQSGRSGSTGRSNDVKVKREGSYYVPEHIKSAGEFHKAIKEAKEGNPFGAFVTLYDEADYKDKKMFTMGGGAAGIAVTKDGDIVSVFKNPEKAKELGLKNVSDELLTTALKNGGTKLDCFDGFLPRLYMQYGFEPVCRIAFSREYAPDKWNYERDKEPDVVFFKHNGDDIDTIRAKQANGSYPTYNIDDVPLVADYDEGLAMRDKKENVTNKSLDTDLNKGIGGEMQRKYPGGHWVTMNGRHVYITKGGQVSKETDPRGSKSSEVRNKATSLVQHGLQGLEKGHVHRYNNQTVQVEQVGRKYVTVSTGDGKKHKIDKKRFNKEAKPKDLGQNIQDSRLSELNEQGRVAIEKEHKKLKDRFAMHGVAKDKTSGGSGSLTPKEKERMSALKDMLSLHTQVQQADREQKFKDVIKEKAKTQGAVMDRYSPEEQKMFDEFSKQFLGVKAGRDTILDKTPSKEELTVAFDKHLSEKRQLEALDLLAKNQNGSLSADEKSKLSELAKKFDNDKDMYGHGYQDESAKPEQILGNKLTESLVMEHSWDNITPEDKKEQANLIAEAQKRAEQYQSGGVGDAQNQEGENPDGAEAKKEADNAVQAKKDRMYKKRFGEEHYVPKNLKSMGASVFDGYSGDDVEKTYNKWQQEASKMPTDPKTGEKPRVYYMQQFAALFSDTASNSKQSYRRMQIGGEDVAYMMFQDEPDKQALQIGYIEISPKHRYGKGLGKHTIAQAIAESHERGHNGKIFLYADLDARSFYEHIGMQHVGKGFYEFESEDATAFYEEVTKEKLGLQKSLDNIPTKKVKFTTESIDKAEDELYPDGVLIGSLSDKIQARSKGKYDDVERPQAINELDKYKMSMDEGAESGV